MGELRAQKEDFEELIRNMKREMNQQESNLNQEIKLLKDSIAFLNKELQETKQMWSQKYENARLTFERNLEQASVDWQNLLNYSTEMI